MKVDWAGFEGAVAGAVVDRVRAVVAGEACAAAALDHVYAETDGVITLPCLAVRPAGLTDPGILWSTADWPHYDDDWLPGGKAWEQAITAAACAGSVARWEATFERYRTALVRACRRARRVLRTGGVVGRDFVVVLLDEAMEESLLRRCLSERELHRHFPEFDAHAAEVARLAALPEGERARWYVGRLPRFDGPVGGEEAARELRRLGPAAVAALVDGLAVPGEAWRAAMLLADVGVAGDDVVAALHATLLCASGPDRSWAACALARLGRLDLVLAAADRLPADVLVEAVAAPYSGFRDRAADPAPLDYRPLEDFLDRYPARSGELARDLGPGRTACTIRAHEVGEALRGLGSPHRTVRWHAASVLGERRLGRAAGRRILPALARAVEHDPDPGIRRIALLSLVWWRRDAREHADVVRRAAPAMSGVQGEVDRWVADLAR